jgi:hypothetical protein
MGFGFWNLPVKVAMERPEMESGLRWRVSERETRSEMESEPERDAVCDGVSKRETRLRR